MSCIFCELAKKRTGAFLESPTWWVRFDIHPVSPLHALVIPKRHVVNFRELTAVEWMDLHEASEYATKTIEACVSSAAAPYRKILENPATPNSAWFAQKMLQHPKLGTKPSGYNYGFNQGRSAGQTVDHLHWHIIPRYDGDMDDPSGGIRYAIPTMGNYHLPRT